MVRGSERIWISPEASYVAAAVNQHVLVLDAQKDDWAGLWPAAALDLHFDGQAKDVVAVTREGLLRRWSLVTSKETGVTPLPLPAVKGEVQRLLAAALSPDGKWAAAVLRHEEKRAEAGRVIRIWSTATLKLHGESRGHTDKV